MQNKLKGMMYGVALGDAIGAPYEFRKGKGPEKFKNYTGLIDKKISHKNRFQDEKTSALGQITDDTEMSLALANSIINKKRYDKDDVTMAYIKWANSKCPFMGKNTRELFKGIKTLSGYQKRYNEKFSTDQKTWTQSNGCLMRASPLAMLPDKDYVFYVTTDCKISNPHPICIDSVIVYITLLKSLIKGESVETAIQKASAISKTNEVKNVIKEGCERKERDIETNKGWVLHALYCVFYGLAGNHKTYEKGINEIIKLGGDTDTNGCIAGAALGAVIGFDKMNKEKLTSKNIKIIKECDTNNGDMKRDDIYTLKKLDSVIEKIGQ
jgi:ADP-ribosylglycohydrolase